VCIAIIRICITPVGPSHKGGHDEKGTVNLVSPVQQSIDQSKDEVNRNIQGIKRKTTDKTVSSTREHRRKQIENVKKVSKKNMKKISKEKVTRTLHRSAVLFSVHSYHKDCVHHYLSFGNNESTSGY
jgi:secreted Zn-dependent insulinase-like peptidase